MRKRGQVAGFNDRFADERFKGFGDGDGGGNVFPQETTQSIAAADPAGTYDGATSILQDAVCFTVTITVTEVFNNTPTIIVGKAGATNILVNLTDAVDLTTLGVKTVSREVIWPSAGVPRVTIGGTPDQGAATVVVSYQI